MKYILVLLIFSQEFAEAKFYIDSDSTSTDTTHYAKSGIIAKNSAYMSYRSEKEWNKTGYNNVLTSISGRTGIPTLAEYSSNTHDGPFAFRLFNNSLVTLNGIPINIYDVAGITSTNSPETSIGYISPLDVSDIHIMKGNSSSYQFGSYGIGGCIALNSGFSNMTGFSYEFQSGFTRLTRESMDESVNIIREGFKLNYGSKLLKSSLIAEYLRPNSAKYFDSNANAYYLSNGTKVSLLKGLEADVYLNYFHQKNSVDTDSESNNRVLGALNLTYSLNKSIQLDGGVSIAHRNVENQSTNNQIPRASDATNWAQKSMYLDANIYKRISDNFKFGFNSGIRSLFKNETRTATYGDLQEQVKYESDLKFYYWNGFIELSKLLTIGYFMNHEKDSKFGPDHGVFNHRTIYSNLSFNKFLKNEEGFLTDAYLRMNHSTNGDNIKILELGGDFSLFSGMMQIHLTRYTYTEDFGTSAPNIAGFRSVVPTNGTSEVSSFELEIDMFPTKYWRVNLSWSNPKSRIILPRSTNNSVSFSNLGNFAVEGLPFNIIPDVTQVNSDDTLPIWLASIYNDITINRLSLGFLVSYSRGGKTPAPTTTSLYTFQGSNNIWQFYTTGPTTLGFEDNTGFTLRNLYVSYEWLNFFNSFDLTLGVSAQNTWTNADISNDMFSNVNTKSIGMHLSAKF